MIICYGQRVRTDKTDGPDTPSSRCMGHPPKTTPHRHGVWDTPQKRQPTEGQVEGTRVRRSFPDSMIHPRTTFDAVHVYIVYYIIVVT